MNYPHDVVSFPGLENPIKHLSVPTEEGSDGITTANEHDTLGYALPVYTDGYTKNEHIGQDDIKNHPSLPTPSGVEHPNPRGPIAPESLLEVPESSVGRVRLEDVITQILSRNTGRITVRQERPGGMIARNVTGLTTGDPYRVATTDDMRYRVKAVLNGVGGAATGLIGNYADVVAGQGWFMDSANVATVFETDSTDELWFVVLTQTGTGAKLNYSIENWERH